MDVHLPWQINLTWKDITRKRRNLEHHNPEDTRREKTWKQGGILEGKVTRIFPQSLELLGKYFSKKLSLLSKRDIYI